MEGKVAYQVGKLVGLAESEERRMREGKGKAAGGKDKVGDDEEEEQGQWLHTFLTASSSCHQQSECEIANTHSLPSGCL